MKWIRVAFSVAQLFLGLLTTEKGRAILDGMLDLVEDAFVDDDGVQKACLKVREALMLPDDD
jgi:hypothetical protein